MLIMELYSKNNVFKYFGLDVLLLTIYTLRESNSSLGIYMSWYLITLSINHVVSDYSLPRIDYAAFISNTFRLLTTLVGIAVDAVLVS